MKERIIVGADGRKYITTEPQIDKQPEALRLADALLETVPKINDWNEAAAELRRLDAMNAELVEALNNIIEEPKNTMSDNKALREIVRIAKAALAKAEGK